MPKIFIYCVEDDFGMVAYAVAEDGTGLAAHLCSNRLYVKHDMGINSQWKHDKYQAYYPGGYELVDYSNLEPDQLREHSDLWQAINLNRSINGPPGGEATG